MLTTCKHILIYEYRFTSNPIWYKRQFDSGVGYTILNLIIMPGYPQTQSHPITNMVAELNAILGAQHFIALYEAHIRQYELALTEFGKSSKKYSYLATEGTIPFSEMFQYLNGILMGYRLAKQMHKF